MEQATSGTQDLADLAGKYLTFGLGDEEYGLEILKVREIIGLMDITPVPRTPHHIRGVINLRGRIIPVLHLRVKFGMEVIEDTDETCIIVLDTETGGVTSQMGVLVDQVCEVIDITSDQIEPTPAFGDDVNADFIRGMAKHRDIVTILLNTEQIVTAEDCSSVVPTPAHA